MRWKSAILASLSCFNLLKTFSIKSYTVEFIEFSLVEKVSDFYQHQFSSGLQGQQEIKLYSESPCF